jgi:hypothetical protein
MDRKPNESILEYKYRLCSNREDYELSWTEVQSLLDKEEGVTGRSPDTTRKWFSSFQDGFRFAITSNATTTEEVAELERKTMILEMERKKKATVSVEYNKVLREESRRELLFEKFCEAIGTVDPPVFNDLQVNVGKRGAVLGFADVHYGKAFQSVNNKYNEKILIQRMERLLAETVAIVHKENIDHLDVVNAGDSVEGIALRISQLTALQYGMIDSSVKFQRLIVEWLQKLSKEVKITYHHITSANHTELRPLGTSAGQFPAEDIERMIMTYVHDILEKNDRITVPDYLHDPIARFKVCGYLLYAAHGHAFRGMNIENVLGKMSQMHREFIDYLIVGHFHHAKEVTVSEGASNNCELLMLPSVMGSDEFSDSLMTGAKPGAKLYIFESCKGKVMGYDIRL